MFATPFFALLVSGVIELILVLVFRRLCLFNIALQVVEFGYQMLLIPSINQEEMPVIAKK
jgi:hypothetical protein